MGNKVGNIATLTHSMDVMPAVTQAHGRGIGQAGWDALHGTFTAGVGESLTM